MTHGIHHAGNTLAALPALFPDIRDHVRLAIIQKCADGMEQLRSAKGVGIISYDSGHAALQGPDGKDFFQVNDASRSGNKYIHHIQDDEGVRGVIAA